jgi:hypothetical protein
LGDAGWSWRTWSVASYDDRVFGIVFFVVLGILIGDVLRRARLRRELESEWRRVDQRFLDELRRAAH